MVKSFEFRVPASSANLGPGFGVLGLALDLCFDIRVEERNDGRFTVQRPDATSDATLDLRHDAILRGLTAARDRWKIELPKGLTLIARGDVPRGCGLGSNSADFVAGMQAAVHYAKVRPPLDEQLGLLVELGADPAHGAATLFGGLVVAVPVHRPNGAPRYVGLRHELHDSWHFVIVAPDVQHGTADVHRVVPAQLPNAVTLRTAGRLVGLLRALETGDEKLLEECLVDEVHVPFRIGLAPGMREALAAARSAGAAGVTISGHGPALIAITADAHSLNAISAAMTRAFAALGTRARALMARAWTAPHLAAT